MNTEDFSRIFSLIREEKVDEQTIIDELEKIVQYGLDYRTEELFSKLYRLDIDEQKIKAAMEFPNLARSLAQLIFRRQIEKNQARAKHLPEEPPEELRW